MPGYEVIHQRVAIAGVADLFIRSLLDRRQFADPLGTALRLGISSAAWPLFGLLWPSGQQLAARLALHPVRVGERILEIGCGLALASLVGHRRGADMTASDGHPLAGVFLRENLRLNGLPPMPYRHGRWSPDATDAATHDPALDDPVEGRYDLIIGSDLLYERDDAGALASFIGRHVQPDAEVWVVDPNRGNRPAFNRRMVAQGYRIEDVPLAAPYRGRLLIYRRPG